LRVLRVIDSMDPQSGGPCQGIRNSVKAMQKHGVENEVVCLDSPNSPFISKDSFKIYALGPHHSPWHHSPKLISWLEKNIQKYDAVIVHGLWLFSSYAVEKSMRGKHSPPWFVMPHGMLDPYFQKSKERRIKAIRNSVYWRIFEKKVINRSNGILFTTQEELLLARETFPGYRPKKELNVGYGIQNPPDQTPEMTEAFYKAAPQVKDRAFILFLGRIHPKKGVDNLVRAFSEVEMEGLSLVIAGPGVETEFGEELKAYVSKMKMEGKIFFPGMLEGASKWGAFYESQVFILPSHQENFGIAVAEALACKKPVLISDRVNIWREISANKCGYVRPDTLEGTKELLEDWVCTSDGAKAEMMENARFAFRDKFDINSNVKKLIQVLAQESD